jgi:hypothetical protein
MRALRTLAQVVSCIVVTGCPRKVLAQSLRRRASTTQSRTSEGLGARPTRVNLAGLKL